MTGVAKKESIRAAKLAERGALSLEEVSLRSARIFERLCAFPLFDAARLVMVYLSFGKEVNTQRLVEEFLLSKNLVVPKVEGNRLVCSRLRSLDHLCRSKFGVLEPDTIEEVAPSEIDLFLVPGIAFDRLGWRIGWGKGYYDSFLAGAAAPKIGLAYDFQLVEPIPHDPWDVRMNGVVTESEVLSFSQRS